jgi:hypothetical protein
MTNTPVSIVFFENLKKSLSASRFSGYHQRGSEADALAKYLWNTRLCEALYCSLQMLEVTFRNRVHIEIGKTANNPTWLMNEIGFLPPEEKEFITEAKKNLARDGCPVTEDYLVSEMKFGFWTSLLNANYDRMWPKLLPTVFPHIPSRIRTRGDVSVLMNKVRRLRNAAMHHHSIWHWRDLQQSHQEVRLLISYMCKQMGLMAEKTDRFPEIYTNGIGDCQKIVSAMLKQIQPPSTS